MSGRCAGSGGFGKNAGIVVLVRVGVLGKVWSVAFGNVVVVPVEDVVVVVVNVFGVLKMSTILGLWLSGVGSKFRVKTGGVAVMGIVVMDLLKREARSSKRRRNGLVMFVKLSESLLILS